MLKSLDPAPELQTSDWLNTSEQISLKQLRGKVVVIEAFQMLCPGCVSHGLPQAARIIQTFANHKAGREIVVLGLHTVFEHHEAQGTKVALEAFLHENRIQFPVAIDAQSDSHRLPQTMRNYHLQGTPSLILIDKEGRYREQYFGAASDLIIGANIMELVLDS